MASILDIGLYLGRDSVEQAVFQAERVATSELGLHLLDAVLENDVQAAGEILSNDMSGRQLDDRLMLALCAVLVGQGSREMIEAFDKHGYSAAEICIEQNQRARAGDMALYSTGVERQRELIEMGFLKARQHALAGMKSADPAMFDLWSQAWFAADPRSDTKAPSATLCVFQWIPETARRKDTPTSRAVRQEFKRRLECMIDGFFRVHYPADSADEQWKRFMAMPPNTFGLARTPAEAVIFMQALVDRFFSQHPQVRALPAQVEIEARETSWSATLAAALLRSGYGLGDFEGDLARSTLDAAITWLCEGKNPPASISLLWKEVLVRLETHDPQLLEALPWQVKGEGASLQLRERFDSHEDLVAFCGAVLMQMGTRPVSGARPGPRL